jgi:hypothetical protein
MPTLPARHPFHTLNPDVPRPIVAMMRRARH